jgi:excisionase family DNA binding protein
MLNPHRKETMARLSVKDAANYVPCGVSTLNKLRVKGGGPRFIKLGGRVLYDTRDLDQWIEANKYASTSDRLAA